MKKLMIRSGILLIAASTALFFWSDIKNVVASPDKSKQKKEKKAFKSEMMSAQSPVSEGISIVQKWDLPKVLTEISGIAHIEGDRFLCVQDELGTLYIYNTAKNSIEKEIQFGGAGDYEGLAIVDKTAWVIRADGKLFEVASFESRKPIVKEYDTPLTVSHNVEGLCYDKFNNRLLLAIKDDEPGNKDYKGIYAFDMQAKKLAAEPVIKLMLNDKIFAGGKKSKDAIYPSAIAIHPTTKEIYITDGKKGKLLILDEKGNPKNFYQLNTSDFAQPEGITFKTSGEMYISNEGPKKPGNIVQVQL